MVKTKRIASKEKDTDSEQLTLGLKSPFKNFFYDIKNRISTRFSLFEANTFINDPYVWLLSSIQIIGSFYQLTYILNALPKLPSLLPLFGYSNITSISLIPKIAFLIFPIFSLIIFMLTFRSARSNYFKNESIAIYTLFIGSLINISLSLYLVKIISIYV